MESETLEDDFVTETPVTNEIESFLRDMIRAELNLLRARRFDVQTYRDFAQGARWGVMSLLALLGHKDWAENVLLEELSELKEVDNKRMMKRLGRVIMPGSRITARLPKD